MLRDTDFAILGGGLTGLAAGSVLGDRAIVLERAARPGGLVRADCHDGYWFDHVIHLLYFPDDSTESRIRSLLGDDLRACPPTAWVETGAGTVRFPFQMHLACLKPEVVVRCLHDLAEMTFRDPHRPPQNFEEVLLRTFGREMCEVFLFPYNRKTWKRPLNQLAPSGFTWNITPPDFQQVLRGAMNSQTDFNAYNSNGWYPRPRAGAPVRGMEVLSAALADQVPDLRLEHSVESIDLQRRLIVTLSPQGERRFRFGEGCLTTLPLPRMIQLCRQAPDDLRRACTRLTSNRVMSVFLAMKGPRPTGRGHWRYYADESVVFTRLIYPHEFDPLCAPDDGWGLMAEITQRTEDPLDKPADLIAQVIADAQRVGAFTDGCEVKHAHCRTVCPAYVVFTVENQPIVDAARRFLVDHGITPMGRYGRWEYSSMGQVLRDGFAWAESFMQPPATLPLFAEAVLESPIRMEKVA